MTRTSIAAKDKQKSENPNALLPYFSDTSVRIYSADSLKILASIADKSIDLIFADPPYNLSNDGFSCHAGKRTSVNKGEWDKSRGFEKDFIFHFTWLEACRRVLKDNGTLWISGTYHSIYACGYIIQKQKWHILNDICWFKPNATPHLACRMFSASHENLIWARKTKQAKHYFNYDLAKAKSWEGDFMKKENRQMRSVWAINTPKTTEKRHGKHPTQKPELLLERIILTCSRQNDIVLDPFCGSATTGVVALRENRKFIGIDSETLYLQNHAVPRIKDVLQHVTISAEDDNFRAILPK